MEKIAEKMREEFEMMRELASATRMFLEQHDMLFPRDGGDKRFEDLDSFDYALNEIGMHITRGDISNMEAIYQLGAAHAAFLSKADKWFK